MNCLVFFIVLITLIFHKCQIQTQGTMKLNKLTKEEENIILHKGTEPPFSGIYNVHKEHGTYLCKQCDAPLFYSFHKFESHCGWPSFDDHIAGAVTMQPDADGRRTEIVCTNCGGHLGHVFFGEGFTDKNTRYCVNSLSLNFTDKIIHTENVAYFGAGCFWGVEYFFQKAQGVITAESGYMGGHSQNPTYDDVCTGKTGHAETVKVIYDPEKTTFEKLARLFFEIHDFTQVNRQGPDVGTQYRSVIFYVDFEQNQIARKLVEKLNAMGYNVATSIEPATKFYSAENYHQDYYFKKGGIPYCHVRKSVFKD